MSEPASTRQQVLDQLRGPLLERALRTASWIEGRDAVSRDKVVKEAVAICRTGGLKGRDKSVEGIRKALTILSGLPWVADAFGADVAAAAGNAKTTGEWWPQQDKALLDGLLRLTFEWAIPIHEQEWRARRDGWDILVEALNPPPNSATRRLVEKSSLCGGYGQSVTIEALANGLSNPTDALAHILAPSPPDLVAAFLNERMPRLPALFPQGMTATGEISASFSIAFEEIASARPELSLELPAPASGSSIVARTAPGPTEAPAAASMVKWLGFTDDEYADLYLRGISAAMRRGLSADDAHDTVATTLERLHSRVRKGNRVYRGTFFANLSWVIGDHYKKVAKRRREEVDGGTFDVHTIDGRPGHNAPEVTGSPESGRISPSTLLDATIEILEVRADEAEQKPWRSRDERMAIWIVKRIREHPHEVATLPSFWEFIGLMAARFEPSRASLFERADLEDLVCRIRDAILEQLGP